MPAVSRAARFSAVYALMRAAADVGDHWVQSDHQAVTKGQHGEGRWAGRRACTAHVATYTATQALALAAGSAVLGMRLHPGPVVAALALSAGTHWIADRRIHLRRLADATGNTAFADLGGPLGGSYLLDQAAHHAVETVAALIASR